MYRPIGSHIRSERQGPAEGCVVVAECSEQMGDSSFRTRAGHLVKHSPEVPLASVSSRQVRGQCTKSAKPQVRSPSGVRVRFSRQLLLLPSALTVRATGSDGLRQHSQVHQEYDLDHGNVWALTSITAKGSRKMGSSVPNESQPGTVYSRRHRRQPGWRERSGSEQSRSRWIPDRGSLVGRSWNNCYSRGLAGAIRAERLATALREQSLSVWP
jgi:hypothetical protein